MNVADDRAIKSLNANQIGRIARRECGIDIKTVGRIIVLLRDVDLCIGRQSGSAANSNEKRKFHSPRSTIRAFTNTLTVCQDLRQHNGGTKVAGHFSFSREHTRGTCIFGAVAETSGVS